MLELRPNCECCDRDLRPDSELARICTFECTFCADCAEGVFGGRCPNCGGDFEPPADPPGGEVGAVSGVDRPRPEAAPGVCARGDGPLEKASVTVGLRRHAYE